jgi:peptidoglycan hydrolase-like protein with peptidoglycan-binding domain
MIDEGFTYLHGTGRVYLADGTIVSLPGKTQLGHGDNDQNPAQSTKVSTHPCSDISWVQKRLSELGYDPGPADGVWGAKSRKALKAFQTAEGLEATGELDEQTCKKLQ